jgi:hypothetical protein
METNMMRRYSRTLFIASCLSASVMLAAGCGNKTEEAPTGPSASTSTNVPAPAAAQGQGAQQMGQQQGQNNAANAAAWQAAKAKAEGR